MPRGHRPKVTLFQRLLSQRKHYPYTESPLGSTQSLTLIAPPSTPTYLYEQQAQTQGQLVQLGQLWQPLEPGESGESGESGQYGESGQSGQSGESGQQGNGSVICPSGASYHTPVSIPVPNPPRIPPIIPPRPNLYQLELAEQQGSPVRTYSASLVTTSLNKF